LASCTTRLNLSAPAKRLFTIEGGEISSLEEVLHDDVLVVSSGEPFNFDETLLLVGEGFDDDDLDLWNDNEGARYLVVDQEQLEQSSSQTVCSLARVRV